MILQIIIAIKLSVGRITINVHNARDEHGYYFINVFVGNPPQKQTLILDSGSSQISFTCATCLNCGSHEYPPFDIMKSMTGKNCNKKLLGSEKCKYFHRFNEGSVISGKYFSDTLRFEEVEQNPGIIKDHFEIKYDYLGCNELETKKVYRQRATGVFGIGPKSILDGHIDIINSLLTSLESNINIEGSNNLVISICLFYSGGRIVIGEHDEKITDRNSNFSENKRNYVYWVPIIYPSNVYKVSFEWLSIGSGKFSLLEEKISLFAIIDVGSTYSFFPSKLYSKIIHKFSKLCEFLNKFNINNCVAINQSLCFFDPTKLYALLPIIKIKFGGQPNLIKWIHTSYLIKREKLWCVGIKEQTSYQNHIILGISFIKKRQIILDPRKKRIGFYLNTTARCKYEQNKTIINQVKLINEDTRSK
ncbi:Eukaryotic aspartyl protease family protein [Cryptosporidium meleagridis]|uniref:Eukaryotic aspartyl protease family protein n=1 Tax=Cryptosporidium meleagridis TaxID=93969 RepID=A0A2P4YWE0_9CRYT|nr:Eukaryotic aspartyl protease family protein [Cryptosporidium meleagridis]